MSDFSDKHNSALLTTGTHEPAPTDLKPTSANVRRVASLLVILASTSWADAAPLAFDNFAGPVANANGQFPTVGVSPWVCSGPASANCVRGNGQLTTSNPGAGTVYYLMHLAETPGRATYRFIDAKEPPTFVIAVTRDSTLNNMWHADGYSASASSFAFRQSYWCDVATGCSASAADVTPAQPGYYTGSCPATIANRSYIGSLSFYGDTAVATLQDGQTGALLCSNTASDPRLHNLIGPNFYLQSFFGSPNVVFTSVEAASTPPPRISQLVSSGPGNIRAVANAVDASFLNNSTQLIPLLSVAPSALEDSLAQLSGEIASLSAGAAMSLSSDFMDVMLGPLSAARGNSRTGQPVQHQRVGGHSDRWDAWIAGYGGSGHRAGEASTGAHREEQTRTGVMLGFDYRPTASFSLGGAIGQARLDWSLPSLGSTSRADVTQAGLYAAAHGSRRYIEMGLAYSALAVKTVRNVTLAGLNQHTGGLHASNVGARVEAGEHFWQHDEDFPLMFYAAAEAQRFSSPAYTEDTSIGSSATALAISSQEKTQTFTDLGLRVDSRRLFQTNADMHASVAWRHSFAPAQTAIIALQASPATPFAVAGAPLDSDTTATAFGVNLRLPGGLTLGAAFTGAFGPHSAAYGGLASLRHGW